MIVATLGTKLYDGDKEFVIKRSKLRGVESNGMLCFGCDTKNNKFTFVGADVPNGQIIG